MDSKFAVKTLLCRTLTTVCASQLLLVGAAVVPQSACAQTESVLYTFSGDADGVHPNTGLIMDKKGNLYGTTYYGGSNGWGVVFKVAPPYGQGSETVLYTFSGGADGGGPQAGLLMDKKGNLYGTTSDGGSGNGLSGFGTVFKVAPPYGQGSQTVLYTFSGGADGAYPDCSLFMDKNGNLYGTTYSGGSGNGLSGFGTVFKIAPPYGQGSETVLYTFSGGADGAYPATKLIMDKKGNLYGSAPGGGISSGSSGMGVIFQLAPPYGQNSATILHTFTGGADGAYPYGDLILDKRGNLYAITDGGADGYGVVFKLAPPYNQSSETVLYTFSGGADGSLPLGGLTRDKKGNLYGTTLYGGNGSGRNGNGVVFKLASPYGQGSETVLYTFSGGADGAYPDCSLLMNKKGDLFGSAYNGGNGGNGVVFEITP